MYKYEAKFFVSRIQNCYDDKNQIHVLIHLTWNGVLFFCVSKPGFWFLFVESKKYIKLTFDFLWLKVQKLFLMGNCVSDIYFKSKSTFYLYDRKYKIFKVDALFLMFESFQWQSTKRWPIKDKHQSSPIQSVADIRTPDIRKISISGHIWVQISNI
jgi:hypothetical protein